LLIGMTGASGFVGRHIARELRQQGHQLRCLFRSTSPVEHLRMMGATLVVGELDDEARIRQLVNGVDSVVHAAMYHTDAVQPPSRTQRETYLRKNLFGGALLLEFAVQQKVPRFLHISTLAVYGSTLEHPKPPRDESVPLQPDSLYGTVKYAIENSGLSYGADLGFQVLRPGWVFGDQTPRGRNCWHPIVDRLKTGEDIPVKVGAYMIWVEDLAKVAVKLLESPIGQDRVFNGHSGYLDWYRVTEIGKEIFASRSKITGEPAPPSPCPIVAERIKTLGVPFRVEEGVRRTLHHIGRL
jgi:nucleoside-diphosphate-sugar epimerase